MAKRTKAAPKQESTRNHYGRVYSFAESPAPKFSARIWADTGRDVWHTVENSADEAYAKMREQALLMAEPVDLWRHGNEFVETVNNDLPF